MSQFGILFYVSSFPKLSESFILNELIELERRGHDVAVFANDKPDEDIVHEELNSTDIQVHYANVSDSDLLKLISPSVAKILRSKFSLDLLRAFSPTQIGRNLLLAKECVRFVESLPFEVDVLHGHFATSTKLGELFAGAHLDTATTITPHAAEIFKNPNVPQIAYLCNGVDHVVVPSNYNRNYLIEEIGVENEITVVPATTSIEKFESSVSEVHNRILTVGRLVEKKGHEFGLEAVDKLRRNGCEVEYHIVGTGPLEEELRQKAADLGVEGHVEFLGHISDDRLRTELGEASVFLLPCVIAEDGDRDAMPVVLKEAMAAETACVSTTVSAIPELITHEHDGILVAPRNPKAIFEALNDLLKNPSRRATLARNGYETVHNSFDVSDSVDILLDVFSESVG